MDITAAGTPPFVRFDDGTWVTELTVAEPVFDPDSARAGQVEWPPGFWALAGRRETLVHPSVRAMLLQIRSQGAA